MTHPFAPQMEYAFSIALDLTGFRRVSPSAMGEQRAAVYAAGGTIDGPRLKGTVVPMSGGDFPLIRPNGVIDFDARYLLEADDGAIIYMQNRGYRWPRSQEIANRMNRDEAVNWNDYYMRVTPKFDAPAGRHEWLSQHVFVGVAEKIPGANRIHYFMVL